jgi:hypothetical protein
MKNLSRYLDSFICVASGLFFWAIFYRQVILSRFDHLIGFIHDGRFCGVILEHWWQAFQGSVHWMSPIFFFPVQGVLGYSDSLFLYMAPYCIFRFFGMSALTSFQTVLLLLPLLGWVGSFVFFRGCLRLGRIPSIIGSFLFVFPNSMATSSGHVQLLTIYFIPWLAISLYAFFSTLEGSLPKKVISGICAAVLVPAIFMTSYYVGWFIVFFFILLFGVAVIYAICNHGLKAVCKYAFACRGLAAGMLPYLLVMAVLFIPFFMLYIPVASQFGSRGFSDIVIYLPALRDYVNLGWNNIVWGHLHHVLFSDVSATGFELEKGLPVITLAFFMIASGAYIARTIKHKGSHAKKITLAAWLGASVFLAWALMLRCGDRSLWYFVYCLTPGAGAIRAVYRFQHVLMFPVAIVLAVGAQHLIDYVRRRNRDAVSAVLLLAVSIMFLSLIVEHLNIANLRVYSKEAQERMIADIPKPPSKAGMFALYPIENRTIKNKSKVQIDAMMISQRLGMNTINGYSGLFPPGWWKGLYDLDNPEIYMAYLKRWAGHYNLDSDSLYLLDMEKRLWIPAKDAWGNAED